MAGEDIRLGRVGEGRRLGQARTEQARAMVGQRGGKVRAEGMCVKD